MERIRLADKTRKISLETRETEFRIGTENRGQFRLSPDYGLWIMDYCPRIINTVSAGYDLYQCYYP